MEKFLPLIVSFLIIGVGAYGGGMVTIPLMQHELTEVTRLISPVEMSRLIAIAQMTPGPIAVNGATFVGFRAAGIAGALIATFCVILPGLSILTALSFLGRRMKPSFRLLRLRRGLRMGVLSLLLYAVWQYGREVIHTPLELIVALVALLFLIHFEGKLHPLVVIAGSGITCMLIF
jgi:chromate transporter